MNLIHHSDHTSAKRHGMTGVLHNVGRDAHVDWVIILTISVVVSGALILLGISSFFSIDGRLEARVSVASQASSVNIDVNALYAVLKEYDNRATTREAVLHGSSGPADPSL